MRDPNRIDKFLKKLGDIWREECPDWRFGQLIVNVFEANMRTTILFSEEDEMIGVFEKYFGRDSGDKDNFDAILGQKLEKKQTRKRGFRK